MIQERFYSCRSFAPVMVRSPIPKEPPTMDLTLTLVAGLKISIPICIKKEGNTWVIHCIETLIFIGDFGDLPIDQIF